MSLPSGLALAHHRHGRLRRQLAEGLNHARQAIRLVGAAARVETDTGAILDGLKPEAIPFGFVQPVVAFGRADGRGWGQRTDKRETDGHDRSRSGYAGTS